MIQQAILAALAVAAGVSAAPHQPRLSERGISGNYSVQVGSLGTWTHVYDTPAFSFLDSKGTYFFQQSLGAYGAADTRAWQFFRGSDIDTATLANDIMNAPNPQFPQDTNANTTYRCVARSPTGRESTRSPNPGYSQPNYCDLIGVFVDPDTGDWHGLIHNEFTPTPFGDRLHFDAIDRAISRDGGKTWDITDHVLTSPYSTQRGDNAAFPQQTYRWGAGDQRLITDFASGYHYVLYGSRVVDKYGTWQLFYTHAARAPISAKFDPSAWRKFYNGQWSEPGVGGKESTLAPTSVHPEGYYPVDKEYQPTTIGTAQQQAAAGTAPPVSPLFWMDVSWNAYLGLWIGEPSNVDQSGNAPQEFYACKDLATMQWTKIGDTGDAYHSASNYRWLIDSANKISSQIVGKSFRAYCSFGCSGGRQGEYVNIAIDGPQDSSFQAGKYSVQSNAGGKLSGQWTFKPTGDGAWTISNGWGDLAIPTGQWGRAWGTYTQTRSAWGQPDVGQQWWIIVNRGLDYKPTGTYRLINRSSGLVLSLGSWKQDTTPARYWDAPSGGISAGRKVAEQEIKLTPA